MTKIYNAHSTSDEVLAGINLHGKRFLITGVSAGLGVETARALVAHGAEVVGAVRNQAKAQAATTSVRESAKTSGGSFKLIDLDLASLASVRSCANQLLAEGQKFDVVIANAGIMAIPFRRTQDGFEMQFGTNHLGHFVLVTRITPLISAGGRLVNLSSAGHRLSDVNLQDPNFEQTEYDPWLAYGRSKTANALFAVAFDRRHRHNGIRACSVMPGAISTELVRDVDEATYQSLMESMKRANAPALTYKTIPQGAATTLWAAVTAKANEIGGQYCEDCVVAPITEGESIRFGAMDYALNPDHAEKLWAKSEEMVGERF